MSIKKAISILVVLLILILAIFTIFYAYQKQKILEEQSQETTEKMNSAVESEQQTAADILMEFKENSGGEPADSKSAAEMLQEIEWTEESSGGETEKAPDKGAALKMLEEMEN